MLKSKYKNKEKLRKTLRRQKARYYRKTQNAENKGQRWTVREIELVMDHSIPDTELSAVIGRSVASIQAMRCKQKKSNAEKMKKQS